jgi:DNA invertase Pin-like site-specific DNA recombinase
MESSPMLCKQGVTGSIPVTSTTKSSTCGFSCSFCDVVCDMIAELERSSIGERVRAGLRDARAKDNRLGRPRISLDAYRRARLRAEGRTVRDIADALGPGVLSIKPWRIAIKSAQESKRLRSESRQSINENTLGQQ